MNRAMWRQIRANLRAQVFQHFLLFLVLTGAALLVTVGLAAYTVGFQLYDRLMAQTQGAHIWLYFSSEYMDVEQVVAQVKAHPKVVAVSPPLATFYMVLIAPNGDKASVVVRDLPEETPVNRLLRVAGREPKPASDEIYLDVNLARVLDIALGDRVRLVSGKRTFSLQVVGFFISAENCAFPNCNPAPVYLGPGTLAQAMAWQDMPPKAWEWDLALRIRQPENATTVLRDLLQSLGTTYVSGHTWLRVREVVGFDTRLQSIIMLVFALMAAAVGLFFTVNNVQASLRHQARLIGLLRAVGFTDAQIAGLYLGEHVLLALAAEGVGLLLGLGVAVRLLEGLSRRYASQAVLPSAGALFLGLGSLLAVMLVAAWWPLRRLARMDTVTVLRLGMEPPRRRAVRLPHLPVPLAHGLTQLMAVPSRTLLSTAGLAVVTVAMVVALVLYGMVQVAVDDPARLGLVPQADVYLWASNPEQARTLLDVLQQDPRVARFAWEVRLGVRLPDETEDMYPRFLGGDADVYANLLLEGHFPQNEEEVAVTYTLARKKGWRLGDTIQVGIPDTGREYRLRIVGLYRDSDNLGRMMVLPVSLVDRDFGWVYWVVLQPQEDPQLFWEDMKARFGETLRGGVVKERFRASQGTDVGAMLQVTVSVLAVLLSGVAGLGIFASLNMNVHEERRNFAVLKAIGMTPGQVVLSLVTMAGIMALLAYPFGLGLGVLTARGLFLWAGTLIGLGPIWMTPSFRQLLLPAPLLLLVALLATLPPALRAVRIPVVQVLREE